MLDDTTPPDPPRLIHYRQQSWWQRHWDGLWASIYAVFWLGVAAGIAIDKLFGMKHVPNWLLGLLGFLLWLLILAAITLAATHPVQP